MNKLIPIALDLLALIIKEEPAVAAALKTYFSKPDPTPADWLAMKAHVLGTPFETLAPDAKTVPDEPQAPV